jgi:uncharacterized protein
VVPWLYARGVALDAHAWSASDADIDELLPPIQLWGTEEGWRKTDAMSDADQVREQNMIPQSVRAAQILGGSKITAIRTCLARLTEVGRNDPCPCDSGRKYKYCCLQ